MIATENADALKLEYLPISKLKNYERNAREHGEEDISAIMSSIEQFGFNDPIGVWGADNIIVEGHGRLQAAKKLGYKKLPVIRLDTLTDEQRKAYALAHNRTAELSSWIPELVDEEVLDALEAGFDMEEIGFEIPDPFEEEEKHQRAKEATLDKATDILNTGKGIFESEGYYDIPKIRPVYEIPDIEEWIGFNYVLSDKRTPEEKSHTGVHFFLDDYQFERIWTATELYVDKLSQYGCVASPDFSPVGGLPMATQIWNHYRKHWVGAYLQARGVTVIPTLTGSTENIDWWLDGEPRESIVITSAMWTSTEEMKASFKEYWDDMINKLNPSHIFVYGKLPDDCKRENTSCIPTFASGRFVKEE